MRFVMAIINLNELNQKILDADMIGLFYTSTYTPSINSLKVVSDSVYLDKIKRLIFSSPKSVKIYILKYINL